MTGSNVSAERLALIRDGITVRLNAGLSGAPDLDRDIASAITELLALRTPSDGVKVGPVTRDDAIAFLETACRNWSSVPKLSEDDIGDVAMELLRFATKRLATPGKE